MWARIRLALVLIAFSAASTQPKTSQRVLRLAGKISARRVYKIAAPMLSGSESRPMELIYLVKAGAPVKKGQTIAQLGVQSTAEHGDNGADPVKQAKSVMMRRRAEQAVQWETLQQSLHQAKSDLERAKMDARQAGDLGGIERELLRLNAEETEARYAKLLEMVKLQKASFDAELRILDLTRERLQRQQDRYTRSVKQLTFTAPMDGLAVIQGKLQQGDPISPGQLFMKVVDAQSMQLEAHANQAESSLLRVGQKVNVRLDAYPEVLLPGHISSIGVLALRNGGQNYYIRNIAVNIAIDGSDPKLVPDLAASGDVTLNLE